MTTAFILALIAALALAAILFFAINYIRKLERDNMRLAQLWSTAQSNLKEISEKLSSRFAVIEKGNRIEIVTLHEREEADNGVHSE